jgi:hypothetical protein
MYVWKLRIKFISTLGNIFKQKTDFSVIKMFGSGTRNDYLQHVMKAHGPEAQWYRFQQRRKMKNRKTDLRSSPMLF